MATLLSGMQLLKDIGIFETIVPFVLVAAITYGILSKVKAISDNTAINMTVSVIFALIFTSFLEAVKFMNLLIPYLIGFFTVLLIVLMLFQFLGAKEESFAAALKMPSVYLLIIGLLLLFVFMVIGQVFPAMTTNATTTAQGGATDMASIIFHPKMLGVIVIFMVMIIMAIMFMPKEKQP